MPGGVRCALVLLWVAWAISVCAWIVHLYETGGSRADAYAIAGFPAALLQAFLFYLLGRGNNVARILVLVMAVPSWIVVQMFFSAQFNLSSPRLLVEAALRGTAVILLLTSGAAHWFKRTRVAERRPDVAPGPQLRG